MFGSRMEGVRDGVVLEIEPRVTAVYSGIAHRDLGNFLNFVLMWEREGYDSPAQVTKVGFWAYHEDVYSVHILFSNRGTFNQFEEDFAKQNMAIDLS